MNQGLRTELSKLVGPAQWEWLKPHISRDAVVIVAPQLDLIEVGMALATDNVLTVQHWVDEALLTKPSLLQLQTWDREGCAPWNSLIVQPYVLVQEITAPA